MSIEIIHLGGSTQRFHTTRTITPNTVAEHSFGVAWACYILSSGKPSASLLMAALAHDLPEFITGDIPSPAKRKMNIDTSEIDDGVLSLVGEGLMDLLSSEERTLKLADCLDGMMFCVREKSLGNKTMGDIFGKYCEYIEELGPSGVEKHLYDKVVGLWEAV